MCSPSQNFQIHFIRITYISYLYLFYCIFYIFAIKEENLREELDLMKFRTMKQNNITSNTNKLLLAKKNRGKLGEMCIEDKNFTLSIEDYDTLEQFLGKKDFSEGRIPISTVKIFTAFIVKLTETGCNNSVVKISLSELAKMYGKDITKNTLKDLRKQINKDMKILRNVKITYTPKRRNIACGEDYIDTYLFGGTKGIKNNIIFFKFNEDFFKILQNQKTFLYLPMELLGFNEKYNPHSYLLLQYITEHRRINTGRINENKIKVKSIYEHCKTLPRYEDIQNNRAVNERIIAPFERDLDNIQSFTWEYEKGQPFTFNEWLESYIVVNWGSYPVIPIKNRKGVKRK